MTTVACLWVRGHVDYGVQYVERLAAHVAKWMDRPSRLVCFTDRPKKLPAGVQPIVIHTPAVTAWWAKLELFNPKHGLSGRVLYLDLDTLPVASLGPIVDVGAPLALCPHAGTFEARNGLVLVKKFNGSVMVFDGGTQAALYQSWTPAVAKRLWSDQDWIAEQSPSAVAMPLDWFPRLSDIGDSGIIPAGARVILTKKPKNHLAAQRWPWFDALWKAA
jgi:hypothetical protein